MPPRPKTSPRRTRRSPISLRKNAKSAGKIILSDEMKENFGVCPKCGHYKKLSARDQHRHGARKISPNYLPTS